MARTLFTRALRTLVRWTAVFAAIGFVLGLMAMFGRVSVFAESGSSNPSFARHADWIPILTGIGAAVGFALGLLAAIIGTVVRASRGGNDAP